MSPAKSKKAASAARKAGKKPGKSVRGAKPAKRVPSKGAKKVKVSKTKAPAGKPKPSANATGHAHCAATDPFGGSCQNLPRRPSRYCVIHSYLER